MDDQTNQSEQVPQPEQSVPPPPSAAPEQLLSKPKLIGLGVLLVVALGSFFFFFQNTFSQSKQEQPKPSSTVSQTDDSTQSPHATNKPIPFNTPKPTHTSLHVEDTVSVTLPKGWKDTSISPITMSYVSSDFANNADGSITNGALFSITIAPNVPVMTARERMDILQGVTADQEPYFEHLAIGNQYGLYYDNGTAHMYIIADDNYYWTILFKCKDDCINQSYLDQRDTILNGLVFRE
jgi:hypothetical protein